MRADQHIVEYAQVSEHAAVLERAGESERGDLLGREARHVAASECHRASVRRVEAGDEIEHGRLAGAVRADDADKLAFVD